MCLVERASVLVDLLVDEVLDRRSVALVAPRDGIEDPEVLRRTDGSSVYTVAGADLYTSQRILHAEQRLVATAGSRDGAMVDESAVDLALLEMAANTTALDAGQASLVRQMCTSGVRLQLAIAPAGAGKTTAMRALTLAWTQDGGQVLGLAPSAAAAAVLAEQTGIRADTLAKLTWSLRHGELPDWAAAVGPSTLVIIDEAGMADTLSLDTAVQFAIGRGGSVRLVGDDQQLGAIGAGGVLRDIKQSHGALHLAELHRFTNPGEAAASLALREGKPTALDFYLDHGRVHVGDIASTTEDALAAWLSDRAVGLDAIMLAPTRELVAELNRRARDHRLDQSPASWEVRLADGNQASVGDVIITRSNDRRLRLTATDWVKNGDRWTITQISKRGGLTAPPTASIPKTHDQPEETNSKRFRPSGNSASTGTSPVPPTRQQVRGPTSDRQRTPHLDAGTTTRSARTKNPNGVRAGRPRPADKHIAVVRSRCSANDSSGSRAANLGDEAAVINLRLCLSYPSQTSEPFVSTLIASRHKMTRSPWSNKSARSAS
jgi:hypothetical protein